MLLKNGKMEMEMEKMGGKAHLTRLQPQPPLLNLGQASLLPDLAGFVLLQVKA